MRATQSELSITPAETEILATIAPRYEAVVETLLAWSAQNSGSHNRAGLAAMREHLKDYFAFVPGVVREVALAPSTHIDGQGQEVRIDYEPAVEVCVRPDAPIQIVMTGHYDTVFPEHFHFQSPQYLDDETVNGPGTADMKGGILVMAEALRALEQSDHKERLGYTILLSPDEEIGSPGSRPLLMERGQRADIGMTYEPALADGSMAGARKGSGNFTVVIKGRAAHAGREHHLGRNALNALAEFTLALNKLNGQRDGATFNMGKFEGGGPVNIVPELAIGRFNVRMERLDDMEWMEQKIHDLVSEIDAKDGISAHLHGGFTRPPKPMAPANAMVFDWVRQAGGLLGQEIRWSPSGGVCEGNNLWAAGCPNVDTLGVRGGHIHSDQEFIKLPSLTERAELSALILLKLASGEFDAKAAKALVGQSAEAAE